MEKQGTPIHWLDGYMPMEEKIEKILGWYSNTDELGTRIERI
jgi:hypothetical protein